MELQQSDAVTVMVSAHTMKASLWGIFGALFLTFGINQLLEGFRSSISTVFGLSSVISGAVQAAIATVLLFAFGMNLANLTTLAKKAKEKWGPLTIREGDEVRGLIPP